MLATEERAATATAVITSECHDCGGAIRDNVERVFCDPCIRADDEEREYLGVVHIDARQLALSVS